MDIVWLVQWTRSGAIICLRQRAVLARVEDHPVIRLQPVTAWFLNGGIITPATLKTIDKTELCQALRFAERTLTRVGSESDTSIRAFGPHPVHYDPYRAREYWLGSATELRDDLLRQAEHYLTS
jgi:hypothetical protein